MHKILGSVPNTGRTEGRKEASKQGREGGSEGRKERKGAREEGKKDCSQTLVAHTCNPRYLGG
jgi:hypothetical protein